jgi:hypothetical protein
MMMNAWGGNNASYGNSFSSINNQNDVDMSDSYFDVYNCSDQDVGEAWIDVDEDVNVDYSNSAGDLCAITEDVWVSPDGDDGTDRSTNIFKTITRALEVITPDTNNIITIHISEGTFSPSATGEYFPIIMISNVNLLGVGDERSILNAERTGRVIESLNLENITIQSVTITGGYASQNNGGGGGGLSIAGDGLIQDVIITDNIAEYDGGGVSMWGDWGNSEFRNVQITNNQAEYGGGLYMSTSESLLNKVLIADNTSSQEGGGLVIADGSWPLMINVTIANNMAGSGMFGGGGAMFVYFYSNATILNSIMWDNTGYQIVLFSEFYGEQFVVFNYSDAQDSWVADNGSVDYDSNSINMNPMFVDADNGDYSLDANSPCINTGTMDLNSGDYSYWLGWQDITFTIEENDYYDTAPDMGAFEYCSYEIDECGVCDGPGSIYECGCSDPEEYYDCVGNCIADLDCAGICNGNSIIDQCGICGGDDSSCTGCIDDTAYNYDSNALIDDGSCISYAACAGTVITTAYAALINNRITITYSSTV